MGTIQRWYIYLVAAVTLQATTWAVINLLRNLLIRQTNADSAEIALMISIVVIGLPLFLLHWLWAQRKVNADISERGAPVRLVYLYAMLAAFFLPWIQSSYRVLQALLHSVLGVPQPAWQQFFLSSSPQRFWYNAIPVIVLSALWAYHYRLQRIDQQQLPENELTRTVQQLYVYVFAAIGLLMLSIGIVELLHWLMLQIVPQPGSEVVYGSADTIAALTRVITGGGLWVACWLLAQRRFADPERPAERESPIRKLYLYVVIFSAVMSVVVSVAIVLGDVLERLLDVPETFADGDIRLPLSIVIAAGVVWGYHATILRQDSELVTNTEQQRVVRRFYLYLTAGIGLIAVLIGVSGVLSVLIRAVASPDGFIVDLRRQLAWFTALLLAGLPVWLFNWLRAQRSAREASSAGHQERASLIRRSYLYGFLLIATLVILVGAIYVTSQLVELIMGARTSLLLLRDVGQAIAFVAVMVTVWLYHGPILRRDNALVKQESAARMKPLRVVLVDPGDAALRNALVDQIQAAVPRAQLAELLMNGDSSSEEASAESTARDRERIASAEAIVGPWQMITATGASQTSTPDYAADIVASSAHKVVLPVASGGWEWVGIETQKPDQVVKEAAAILKQIAESEDVTVRRRLSPAIVALLVLAGLFILCAAVPFLISVIMTLMFGF